MKVRIIVGPNGSGKTSFFHSLSSDYKLNMGLFINADLIEKDISNQDFFSCIELLNNDSLQKLKLFLARSTINKKYDLQETIQYISIKNSTIYLHKKYINSYVSAAIADFLRNEAMIQKINFTYESVFSDANKINFVKKLKTNNYKIYLYVVATLNPSINIKRIQERVNRKGHFVPEEKIKSRFSKSLINIKKILPFSHRTFILDNSQENYPEIIAELGNNKIQFLHKTYQPNWVNNLLSKK